MDPPKLRQKRIANLKKKEKSNVYSSKHARNSAQNSTYSKPSKPSKTRCKSSAV